MNNIQLASIDFLAHLHPFTICVVETIQVWHIVQQEIDWLQRLEGEADAADLVGLKAGYLRIFVSDANWRNVPSAQLVIEGPEQPTMINNHRRLYKHLLDTHT